MFGLSEVSPEQIDRARKVLPIVTVQNRYNLNDRKWDDVLAYCEKERLGFHAMVASGWRAFLGEQRTGQGGQSA